MKGPTQIYTKVVFDMTTGGVVEEESFDYVGPMALCDGGGGGGEGDAPSWTESLPEDVRQWDEVKNSDAPEKFWDQMVNMRSRMGSSIRIPSNDAGEDDLNAFYQKLRDKVPGLMPAPDFDKGEGLDELYDRMGRPKDAKEYKTPEVKDARGEVIKGAADPVVESLREVAHQAGLSQAKFDQIVNAVLAPSISARDKAVEAHQADKKALADEWGVAYDRNQKIVSNFLAQTDAPESVLTAVKEGTADSRTMKWLHSVASATVGTQGGFQTDNSNSSVMTPEEAAIKISEIRNNKAHPYNNRMDPGNAAAKKYVRELYLLKNPKSGQNAAPGTQFNIGGNV